MNQVVAALDAAWKVLLVGLLLGAGLPTLFAFGVQSLAVGNGFTDPDSDVATSAPNPAAKALAYALFAVVLAAVGLGIAYIVAHGFGYSITWVDSIVPVVKKK